MLMMPAFFWAATKELRLREGQLVRDNPADAHDARLVWGSRKQGAPTRGPPWQGVGLGGKHSPS